MEGHLCHPEAARPPEDLSVEGGARGGEKILRFAQDDREGNNQDDGGGSVQDDRDGDALDGEREKVRMRFLI